MDHQLVDSLDIATEFFLPIKKNRILISAHEGLRYHCNPKYISEYLVASEADVEVIWGFYRPKENANIPNIKAVWIYSPAWYYLLYRNSIGYYYQSCAFPDTAQTERAVNH